MTDRLKLEKYFLSTLIIATALVLLSPLALRSLQENDQLIGESSYYHFRMSEDVLENKQVTFIDNKIEGERQYVVNPYHVMLATTGKIIGIQLASKLLPVILGILSALLFSLLLRYFGMMLEKRIIILALLILTPAFAYTFAVSGTDSAALFFILLASYIGLKKGLAFKATGLLFFLLAASFSLFHAIMILIILSLFFIADIKRHVAALWGALAVGLFMTAVPQKHSYYSEGILRGIISDLGAHSGLGIFNIILACIGIFYLWRKKLHYFLIFSLLLFMIAAMLIFGNSVNPYLAFVLSVFSAYGFLFIFERHWEVPFLKYLAIGIVIIGLLFSQASYISRLSHSEPTNSIKNSLEFLKSQEEGTVLSHHSNGFWIEKFADKTVMEDGLSKRNLSALFYSRNLEESKAVMRNYSIRYIWIDPAMRTGEVWNAPLDGMLFLFRNNETFKNIYSKDGIEIWRVNP